MPVHVVFFSPREGAPQALPEERLSTCKKDAVLQEEIQKETRKKGLKKMGKNH